MNYINQLEVRFRITQTELDIHRHIVALLERELQSEIDNLKNAKQDMEVK